MRLPSLVHTTPSHSDHIIIRSPVVHGVHVGQPLTPCTLHAALEDEKRETLRCACCVTGPELLQKQITPAAHARGVKRKTTTDKKTEKLPYFVI